MPNKNTKTMEVHLCEGCIDMLKEHNPYTCPIKIVKVPIKQCDNYTVNGEFVNLEYQKNLGLKNNYDRPLFEYFVYECDVRLIYPCDTEQEMIHLYDKMFEEDRIVGMYDVHRLSDGSYKAREYPGKEMFLHMFWLSGSSELAEGYERYSKLIYDRGRLCKNS